MVSLASPYNLDMALERGGGGGGGTGPGTGSGGNLEDGVALQLALELSRLNVNSQDGALPMPTSVGGIPIVAGMNGTMGGSGGGGESIMFDDPRSSIPRIKSNNTTECVAVPSSEHVAEIVGRQGCKIKALRAKTNTYIKTPVRGEDPVFVVTGRREDVAMAKREILAAAEHFSQIRATRKASTSQSPPLASPAFGSNPASGAAGVGSGFANGASVGAAGSGENQVTIKVRVPYRVVGLVVGPKGATIKRIQQLTNTYIITPSRDKEPCFEVTGTPENAEIAKREIESYIALRTGGSVDGSSDDGTDYPLSPSSTDFNGPLTPDPIYTSAAHHFSTIREAQMNNRSNHFGGRPESSSGSTPNGPQGGNGGGNGGSGIFFRSKSPSSSSSSSQNFGPFSSHPYKSASGSGLPCLDDGFAVNGFDSAYDPRPPPPSSIWAYGNRAGNGGGGFGSENSAFGPPRRNLHQQQTFDDSMAGGSSSSVIGGRGGRPAFGRAVSEPFGVSGGAGLHLMGFVPSLGSTPGLEIGPPFCEAARNGSQGSGSVELSSGPSSSRQSPTEGGGKGGKECSGCGVRQIVAALVPCGHNLWCMECADSIRNDQQVCPVCQKDVASVLRIIHQ